MSEPELQLRMVNLYGRGPGSREPTVVEVVEWLNTRDGWTVNHSFNPNTGRNLWLVSDE